MTGACGLYARGLRPRLLGGDILSQGCILAPNNLFLSQQPGGCPWLRFVHPLFPSRIRQCRPGAWTYVHKRTFWENVGAATNMRYTTCTSTSSVVTNGWAGTYSPDDRAVSVDRQTWDEDAVPSVAGVKMIQMEQGDQVPFCSIFEVLSLRWPEFRALLTFNNQQFSYLIEFD